MEVSLYRVSATLVFCFTIYILISRTTRCIAHILYRIIKTKVTFPLMPSAIRIHFPIKM